MFKDLCKRFTEVQRSSGLTKHLKPPTVFQPENRGEELGRWMDWRFQFETFVGAVDPGMLAHVKNAEKEESPITDGLPQVRSQSERLYSLLTGLMKRRQLRLVWKHGECSLMLPANSASWLGGRPSKPSGLPEVVSDMARTGLQHGEAEIRVAWRRKK